MLALARPVCAGPICPRPPWHGGRPEPTNGPKATLISACFRLNEMGAFPGFSKSFGGGSIIKFARVKPNKHLSLSPVTAGLLLKLTLSYPLERRDRKAIMAFSRQAGRRSLTRCLGLHRFSDDWGHSALRASSDGPAFRHGAYPGGYHWKLPVQVGPNRP